MTALEDLYTWFNEHVDVPPFSTGHFPSDAVSWFKHNAYEPVNKMWDIVALLRDHGVEVRLLRSVNPGRVIYEDQVQVLVKRVESALAAKMGKTWPVEGSASGNEPHLSTYPKRLPPPGEPSAAWKIAAVVFLSGAGFGALVIFERLVDGSLSKAGVAVAVAAVVSMTGTGMALMRSWRWSRVVALVLLLGMIAASIYFARVAASGPPASPVEDMTPIVWMGTFFAAAGLLSLFVILARSPRPNSAVPDWYPDPVDRRRWRYWNGARWTPWISRPRVAPPTPNTK